MKTAFLSDIHANIEALEKVLDYLQSARVTDIYCLGDIIGYGNSPNEVIGLLAEAHVPTVICNHEQLFLSGIYKEEYNLVYTREVLTDASWQYLRALPQKIEWEKHDALLTHTFPVGSEAYYYANSDFSAFSDVDRRFIFLGHTHYPMLAPYFYKKIVNPGSVGQPRDGITKPSFLICDLDQERFEFIRI